jgi:aspartyl-tRNA(Asn)/glutamyl-tRNA(Gln) amidotransferase subunit A
LATTPASSAAASPSWRGPLELARALRERELSSRELVEGLLAEVAARDGGLGAWVRTYPELALAQADEADARLAAAGRGGPVPPPLCGIPFGVKDVIDVAGVPLTLGREGWEGSRPEADAAAWARLRRAGAVLLGHNRSQELALGNAPQLARNPWNRDHSPGGSSNGGAVAVAAAMAPAALGSDVGGSLRRPASACGLTTVMASPGAVPLAGTFTFNRAAEHIGPLAPGADDCALILAALVGAPGQVPGGTPSAGGASRPLAVGASRPLVGTRIGVARSAAWPAASEVEAVFARFAGELRTLGVDLVEFEAPPLPPAPSGAPRAEHVAYFRANPPASEVGSSSSRIARESRPTYASQFGLGVLDRAEREGVVDDRLVARQREATRLAWRRTFDQLRLDAVLLPAQLVPTPLLPEEPGASGDLDRFGPISIRALWNLLGMPVVGLPAGLGADSQMPIGMQLVGLPGADFRLLRIARAHQLETEYNRQSPPSPVE